MKTRSSKSKGPPRKKAAKPGFSFIGRYAGEWLIVAAALLCDINSWGHQFVMDDTDLISHNPIIQAPSHILQIFTSPFTSISSRAGGLYRPLTGLTLAMNYWVSGPNPDSFHLINRLLHVLICLGIFWAIRLLIPRPAHAGLFAGLLFAVHPIQTEAVTYISGRSDELAMLFFVFALLWFIRLRLSESQHARAYVLSLLFYFLALISKENAVTWLGVMLLTELVYFSHRNVRNFLRRLRSDFWRIYAGYVALSLAFVVLRYAVLRGLTTAPTRFSIENPLIDTTIPIRVLTALKVWFQCIGLLLWPRSLSADYSYNQIPLLSHWGSFATVTILLLTVAFFAILIWSYKHLPDLFFGIGFFTITYSIVSNIIVPIGTIRADRLLYLPLLGFCLAGGVGLANLEGSIQNPDRRNAFRVSLGALLLILAARTIIRNRDWRDPTHLYLQALRTSPNSVKVRTYLGEEYGKEDKLDKSLEHYRAAANILPDSAELLNNVGSLLMRMGNIDEAISYFQRAVAAGPARADVSRINLGVALRRRGDLAGAIEQYDKVIQLFPSSAAAHFNKGNALYEEGKVNEAIGEYRQALAIDPQFASAKTNLDIALRKAKSLGPSSVGRPR